MMRGKRWQDMRSVLVSDMQNANKIAIGLINDSAIDAYALNMNYGTYEIEAGTQLNTSFSMYDHATVENLMKENPEIIPRARLDIPKDKLWNRQKLTSAITQGILTGESIPDIARRLRGVADMNEHAAIRNARTYTTAAENKGRVDSYERALAMGIKLKQEWMASLDMRTRASHRLLDGEKVEVGKKFSNGCRYPGDPEGKPWEIYNCRCTLVAAIEGFDDSAEERYSKLPKGLSYEEWKRGIITANKIVNGKDITGTWERREDKFDFEIEDVINAQGYDGLPRVLSGKAFDDAVKAANDGNGWIAQRVYSAPTQETLNAYRQQLYYGKWYVDCSTGGAQYGRGMYCAADYNGHLSDGIKTEMDHYKGLGYERYGKDISYTETFTLDPSAKIITNREINDIRMGNLDWKSYRDEIINNRISTGNYTDDEKTFLRYNLTGDVSWKEVDRAAKALGSTGRDKMMDEAEKIGSDATKAYNNEHERRIELAKIYQRKYRDNGSLAASLGYDAINAEGHGQSGSYTVILNRTKVIFKGD